MPVILYPGAPKFLPDKGSLNIQSFWKQNPSVHYALIIIKTVVELCACHFLEKPGLDLLSQYSSRIYLTRELTLVSMIFGRIN